MAPIFLQATPNRAFRFWADSVVNRRVLVRFNSGRQHHRALAVDNRQHLMSCVPVWPEPCTGPVKESITKSDSFQTLRAECAIFKLSICPNVG